MLLISRFLPPYIVHKAKKLFDCWIPRNSYPGTRINATESGWSEEVIFHDWLQQQFIPSVEKLQKPIVLLMDGHHSHFSSRIIKLSIENDIHIECLPPHTTHILQPLDVLTLSKIKLSWKKILAKHYHETNAQAVSKSKFVLLVSFSVFLQNYELNIVVVV